MPVKFPSASLLTLMVVTYLFALLVAIFPLSHIATVVRPELVCLFYLYWVTHFPQRVGIGHAVCIGLIQDVVEGSVWGGHMLALTLIGYIGILSYQRIASYSIWQQTVWVFVFVGLHQMIVNWMQGLQGYYSTLPVLIISACVSALLWPLVVLLMSRLRFIYRVNSQ